jgi:hypothetical protein
MDNPFAQQTSDPRAIVARVLREASEECPPGGCPIAPMLDRCVEEAVAGLAGSRVTTYVPLLALRRVRSCIRAGTCDTDEFR